MISLFLSFSRAADTTQCVGPLQDITFSILDEQTVAPKSWAYYYSHHNLDEDSIVVKIYGDKELTLAYYDGLECPNSTTNGVNKPANTKSAELKVNVDSNLGLVNFGVYNPGTEEAQFIISATGKNPNNHDSPTHSTFIGIYLGLCIVLLVLFFVHAILARDKVYYKVEVQE